VPANAFTEGSLKKVALKRRASSPEAVAHDLFEENQNLQESLEGEAKKRTKEGSKFIFILFFINFHTPLGNAALVSHEQAHRNGSKTSISYEVQRKKQGNQIKPHSSELCFARG
jgi:hypothetical protein